MPGVVFIIVVPTADFEHDVLNSWVLIDVLLYIL